MVPDSYPLMTVRDLQAEPRVPTPGTLHWYPVMMPDCNTTWDTRISAVTSRGAIILAMALTACGGSDSTSGPPKHGNCTPASASLSVYQGASFSCSSGTGITLNSTDSATYLVVAQFAVGDVNYDTNSFQIERVTGSS